MTITSSSPYPGAPIVLGDVARRHPRAARRLTAAHAAMVRATRGSLGVRWFGAPILLLETAGRRTGRLRTTALVYLPDGDDLVVVAANAGAERAPAWWLNLSAASQGVAIVGRERRPVNAVITHGARRERLWARFAAVAPVAHYQRQARRPLPVIALTPRRVAAAAPERRWSGIALGPRRAPATA